MVPVNTPGDCGARQKSSPKGSCVLRALMVTWPAGQVQSAATEQVSPRRLFSPAVHLRFVPGPGSTSVHAPAGVAAGVASVTIALMPVVQLWTVSRSNVTVPHWRAAGLAPGRFGMLAQSLGPLGSWSFG